MTQHQLNCEVAQATGESVDTIARLGFVPLTPLPVEREPLVMDWDEDHDLRGAEFGSRRGRSLVLA